MIKNEEQNVFSPDYFPTYPREQHIQAPKQPRIYKYRGETLFRVLIGVALVVESITTLLILMLRLSFNSFFDNTGYDYPLCIFLVLTCLVLIFDIYSCLQKWSSICFLMSQLFLVVSYALGALAMVLVIGQVQDDVRLTEL